MASSPTPAITYFISGKVLHKETGSGVADLLIELFDLDTWADPEYGAAAPNPRSAMAPLDIAALVRSADRIGSFVTDAAGRFSLEIVASDFNLSQKPERKPDLVLLVLAPEEPGLDVTKRVLYISRDVRLNAGGKEAYLIRLPTKLLLEREIAFGSANMETGESARAKVERYVARRQHDDELDAGAAKYLALRATREEDERKVFRDELVKQIAPKLGASLPSGVLATGGASIRSLNDRTALSGIERAAVILGREGGSGVPVNLYFTPAVRARLAPFFASASGGVVEIPESEIRDILFRADNSTNPGTLLIHHDPFTTFCGSESANERCAKAHTGLAGDGDATGGVGGLTAEAPPGLSADTLPRYVGKLVENMPSPDAVLRPDFTARRADPAALADAVKGFSLALGPAEVPAFYDFNCLQIAFDHVWKQLFDESIPKLAYTADALGKTRFGIPSLVSALFDNGRSLVDPLLHVSAVEVPPIVARHFDVTKQEFNDMSLAVRDQLIWIASEINVRPAVKVHDLRVIQALTDQGERLIDSVRHDDYYTLHKTLRELHARMSGKYEFTVFAADKDHHSVNFGVLNTYRQRWAPVTYQVGKLLKTIPLAPKEERKYSTKLSRSEKRSDKEARKNSSSLVNEQSSTARVEAEIMAKAQSKNNFSLSAEASFSIGLSEGKASTTFGSEAGSESSQNRKDFREAVLKAVQDYKEETSTEVLTETSDAIESTESGTITNPNDELSVTYLFYELQKRYRLSEQLHRVMPVVLVAEEVPSPDQISVAWVISHDWILSRCLLDDSFRPTLRYLANSSVGDDFSLRELRKNLRQQRNLVDTLRIEFSAASVDADNRYKALTDAVNARIDAEHEDRTSGVVEDLWHFYGGGAPDPEAAKARELAARDEHQYALEKAEKVAAALREEVSTLHTLTTSYNQTLKARLDAETKVDRLLVHIRNNIFYYMQAIWSMEPKDQRYLRLHQVAVPLLELESRSYRVEVAPIADIFAAFREAGTEKHKAHLHAKLKHPAAGFATKPLAEVADLDTLLGFKGNYMIFPMKEHNALTEMMAAPYVDSAFGAMDPDELSNVSLDDYSRYVCCLHEKLPAEELEAIQPVLRDWLGKLLQSPLRNGDEVVVPTGSLFIENLVGKSAILEDYKLKHRELDVFRVDQEVRKAGLENLRLAARLLAGEHGDPDVEKQIVMTGGPVLPALDVGDP